METKQITEEDFKELQTQAEDNFKKIIRGEEL